VREGREFPAADVARQEQDPFAALRGAIEVLVAIVGDRAAYIFTRVFREETDFGKLASERGENLAHNFPTFGGGLLRKRERQVAHADAAKLRVQKVNELSQADPDQSSERTRKGTDGLDYTPRERVFESLPHRANRDRIIADFSLSMNDGEGGPRPPLQAMTTAAPSSIRTDGRRRGQD
jgi:hypothetical protein